ncbi:MAG: esterase [Anaerolineales bacterium]|nr:esterase [Anaerolineales bacterium]
MTSHPIVFLGGFLSVPSIYAGMANELARVSGQKVWVAPARTHHWLTTVTAAGWGLILRILDRTVKKAVATSPTGKVTLVGHSSGGVMARLYLGDKPFQRRVFNGLSFVDTLITLGSPHYNHRGGRLRNKVQQMYPDAFFAPQVKYVSVAGKAVQGKRDGAPAERRVFGAYQRLCGNGSAWGDGFVPIESALLRGSKQITLEGAHHYGVKSGLWYGTPRLVEEWLGSVVG